VIWVTVSRTLAVKQITQPNPLKSHKAIISGEPEQARIRRPHDEAEARPNLRMTLSKSVIAVESGNYTEFRKAMVSDMKQNLRRSSRTLGSAIPVDPSPKSVAA